MAASPPLRNMPSVALRATHTRLTGKASINDAPADDQPWCSVRLRGSLTVSYELREAGVMLPRRLYREDEPQEFDHCFPLADPDHFFAGYEACRADVHCLLAQIPAVGQLGLGLAADDWDSFVPHDVATLVAAQHRRCKEEYRSTGAVPASATRPDVSLALKVRFIYDEPTALVLACEEAAAELRPSTPAAGGECCCICAEGLAEYDAARLPCPHAFHDLCITRWFHRATTCPMCRRDMVDCLTAATGAPKGIFPGIG